MNIFIQGIALLFTLCCCKLTFADGSLSLIHSRLVNMLRTKQKLQHRRDVRNSLDFRELVKRSSIDLREHKLFHSNPELECCPTISEYAGRYTGINKQGLVLELLTNENYTQTFYETICHPAIKNRPCQFIDPRIAYASRCTQQYSYVYAIGRTFGKFEEMFHLDHIRVASGCKCQVKKGFIRKRQDDFGADKQQLQTLF